MLQTAIKAARTAGAIIEKHFDTKVAYHSKNKAGSDLVTIADQQAETAIKKIILKKYPDHGFWGEEGGKQDMGAKYVWVVDPLDGTTNFIHNIPLYSVSIALLKNGKPVMGVVYIPKTKELFYAQLNKGAYCNRQKISVNTETDLTQAMGSAEYWSRDQIHAKEGLREFNILAKQIKKIRYISSTVFEICRVAKGDLNFALLDTSFLDIAAAQLILQEAGGRCEKINIKRIRNTDRGAVDRMLSAHPTLFKTILQTIA